ncbi:hypothetical protein ES703_116012 [subsurface metagenome]
MLIALLLVRELDSFLIALNIMNSCRTSAKISFLDSKIWIRSIKMLPKNHRRNRRKYNPEQKPLGVININ